MQSLNNVSPCSFGVEVTMHYGIAIDLFPLKRNSLKSRGPTVHNNVTHESYKYVLEKYLYAFIIIIYRKKKIRDFTRIGILKFTPKPIRNKICPWCSLLYSSVIQDVLVSRKRLLYQKRKQLSENSLEKGKQS